MRNVRNLMRNLCILVLFLSITNCQHDTLIETQQEETLQNKFSLKSTVLSMQQAEANTKLSTKMRSLATLQTSTIAESVYNNTYNFTIDTYVVKLVENTENGAHSYTFSISRENNVSSILENLVFSYNPTIDDYEASLVTYHFTASQQQEFLTSKHVSTPYGITNEPIAVNLADILGETVTPCTTNYTEYHTTPDTGETFVHSSSIGNVHNDCAHEDSQGNTSCTVYTIITSDCAVSGSSGSSTGSPSSGPTGGNNNTTDTTSPTDDDEVDNIITSPITREESIKQSIIDCINGVAQFNTTDTTTIDVEILEQLGYTINDWITINNYLTDNGCSEAAQESVIGDLLEEFDDQIFKDQSFTNNNCLNSVYTEMGKASTFNNYLKNFEPKFSVAHLRFSASTSLSSNINAETSAPENYLITITFNENNLNRPKLAVARTFIHEIIHAEIFRKLLSISQHPSIQLSQNQLIQLRNNYPGLFDYYMRWVWNVPQGQSPSSAQHEAMAQHYRNTIEQALREYDNTQTDEVYKALAWTGLRDTVTWNNLPQTERNSINQTLATFYANNPNCQ